MSVKHRMSHWVRFLLVLAVIMSAALVAAPTIASTSVTVGNHTFVFHGVQYDFPVAGQSTWYYQVTSGASPEISHLVFGMLCPRIVIEGAGTWDFPDMDSLNPGLGSPEPSSFPSDPGSFETGRPRDDLSLMKGLKFNEGFVAGETQFYYFTVEGNYVAENITVMTKGGQEWPTGTIPGPSPACNLAARLGDRVWLETDKDGIQEAGEAGLGGVTVRLFTGAGVPVATTTTDTSGLYLFNGLAAGTYYVEFVPPVDRYLYAFSPRDNADDAIDSDADRGTGRTHIVSLDWGEANFTLDAGLSREPIQPASVTVSRWEATRDSDTLRFGWTTASELNSLGFDVFAVQPGGEWVKLTSAMIVAQGVGLQPQDYALEVVNPEIALDAVFYLRAYDLNGTHEDFGPIQATVIGAEPPAGSPEAPAPDPVVAPRRNTGTRFLRP